MRTSRATRAAAGVVAALLVLACGSTPTEPARSATLEVTTDKAVYSLGADMGATPMLVNLGPDTVYAPMSEYVYVEKQTAGGWTGGTPWFTVDGVGDSFPVPPGDTLVAWAMSFGYVNREPGVYRFVFVVAHDPRGSRLVPEAGRVSAPFELTP